MIHGDRSQSQRNTRPRRIPARPLPHPGRHRRRLPRHPRAKTSRTSSTTTCPTLPKISFTASAAPDATAPTAWPPRCSSKNSVQRALPTRTRPRHQNRAPARRRQRRNAITAAPRHPHPPATRHASRRAIRFPANFTRRITCIKWLLPRRIAQRFTRPPAGKLAAHPVRPDDRTFRPPRRSPPSPLNPEPREHSSQNNSSPTKMRRRPKAPAHFLFLSFLYTTTKLGGLPLRFLQGWDGHHFTQRAFDFVFCRTPQDCHSETPNALNSKSCCSLYDNRKLVIPSGASRRFFFSIPLLRDCRLAQSRNLSSMDRGASPIAHPGQPFKPLYRYAFQKK